MCDDKLPEGWSEFLAQPNGTTARKVAGRLNSLRGNDLLAAVEAVAKQLAHRSANERSTMSRLIALRLTRSAAPAFLQASAATRLAHPTSRSVRPRRPQAPSQDVPDGAVDPAELARHTDAALDASSMGRLVAALKLIDTFGGTTGYSAQRRARLRQVVNGTTQEHLVDQIGFRAAKSLRLGGAKKQPSDESGLAPDNELAVDYWRTGFKPTLDKLVKKLDPLLQPGDRLVNSRRVLDKLRMVLAPGLLDGVEIIEFDGRPGISILRGADGVPAATGAGEDLDRILHTLGATPSVHQIFDLVDRGKERPATSFEVDAVADLAALITGSAFSRLQELARGRGGLAPVCAVVEHLVLGLTDRSGPKRYDALTADALDSLSRLLDIVVANDWSPSVALRAIDLMMDEIGIVVAVARPYVRRDYRDAMRTVVLDRAPSIEHLVGTSIDLSSHLMTSGMEALATALSIALSARQHKRVASPTHEIDYYETTQLLDKLKNGQTLEREHVLVAALNPSTPLRTPSADKLVADVLERLEARREGDAPFALILDTTIELPDRSHRRRTELDVVLGGLQAAVAGGELEIFLCKSFQKYASFGAGNVAAGDMTILTMKDSGRSARTRSKALLHDIDHDLTRLDEAQIVVHMLKHGHRDELALIRDAAANAEFVDRFCWPVDKRDPLQGAPYVAGFPLLLRSTPGGTVHKLFEKFLTIDRRSSFSFLRTSYIDILLDPLRSGDAVNFVRINTGHESKEAMVEFFYAIGHLATGRLPGDEAPSTNPVDISSLKSATVREHLAALEKIRDVENEYIARYRNSIFASYCMLAAQNVTPKGDATRLILRYFQIPAGRGTIETQRYLAGELLSTMTTHTPPVGADSDPADLAALCRAAAVLPPWWIRRIAEKLQLSRIGDSPQAQQLRSLVERRQPAAL